jgi:hypothetical protein
VRLGQQNAEAKKARKETGSTHHEHISRVHLVVVNGVTVVDIEVVEMGDGGPGGDVGKFFEVKALILVHRRGVVLGPTRAVVFLLPIAILILLVSLMRIGVHAMEPE